MKGSPNTSSQSANLPCFRPKIRGSGKINPRRDEYRRRKDEFDPLLTWAKEILEIKQGWAQSLGDREIQRVWAETVGYDVKVAVLDTGSEIDQPDRKRAA